MNVLIGSYGKTRVQPLHEPLPAQSTSAKGGIGRVGKEQKEEKEKEKEKSVLRTVLKTGFGGGDIGVPYRRRKCVRL